ncbi:hypothetical protein Lfu02_59460 [Longispora fulva]|nr:hypothetical protein Lfu02_59460 [Longispora fulva]
MSVSWSIPGVPAAGLTNITFPMTVNPDTSHTDGTYFAQQYSFTNAAQVGYTGLQPRPNVNGRERLHGVFSSFQGGSTSTDPQCHSGADGGPGVSCAADFDGVYGHRYAITVERAGADTWTGTATDTVTGVSSHIGTYTMPAGSGNLASWQGGFVEYYRGAPTCAQLRRTDAVFGGPTSTDAGGLTGTSRANYEYSECVGQSNYHAVSEGDGTHVTRGWLPGGNPTPKPTTPAPTPTATGNPGPAGTLRNTGSGRCLDDPAGNTANGTRTIVWDCHGATNQRWTATAGKALTIGGKCLDAFGGGLVPGTNAILWDCHGGANQQWTFTADGTIRGVQSGLCLTPEGAGTGNGTRVVLATCTGGTNQRWVRG